MLLAIIAAIGGGCFYIARMEVNIHWLKKNMAATWDKIDDINANIKDLASSGDD